MKDNKKNLKILAVVVIFFVLILIIIAPIFLDNMQNPTISYPGVPTGLKTIAGNAQVTLIWNPPKNNGGSPIEGYYVYSGTSAGSEIQLAKIGNTTTYTATGLTNGQTYYFKVAAYNAKFTSVNSTEKSATPATIPSAPQNLVATPGLNYVLLSWTVPASDGGSPVTNYSVYMGTSPDAEIFLGTIGNVTSYTAIGLANGQAYYFLVAAINAKGIGENSTEANATTPTIPGVPANLTGEPGDTQITLKWDAPASNGGSPVTNYSIYMGTSPGTEILYTIIGNKTTYIVPNLTNDVTYYFKVSAINGVGEGVKSTETMTTPKAKPIAGFPIEWVLGLFAIAFVVLIKRNSFHEKKQHQNKKKVN